MSPTFVPPLRLDAIPHGSERKVAEALQALSSRWVVLHSYPWLRPNRDVPGAPLREGEADFLLLHPDHGLLVVEVKGGELELKSRVWKRAGKEIKNPFEQARRSRHNLLDAIDERTAKAVGRSGFTHGDVVILPHHVGHGDLPFDGDPRTLIDAHGLADNLEDRLVAAAAAYGVRRPMTDATFRRLIDALLPSFRLIRCTAADITDEAARLVDLTEAQHAVLTGLLATPRALIEGVAGSGKTLLAVEYALSLAERGHRTLLVCYNRHLAAWLDERLASEPRLRAASGSVLASSFHSLAITVAHKAGVEFEIPTAEDAAERFWREEAAMILSQALSLLEDTPDELKFDAVVVDEGQDFEPDWWVPIEDLCGGPQGRLYVFLDLHQRLRDGTGEPHASFAARMRLDTNCRNTRAVADAASRLVEIPTRVLPGTPPGEAPVVRRAPSPESVRGLVEADVKALLRDGIEPSQIALLGPASWQRGSLAGVKTIGGTPLVDDARAWRRGEGLIVTTAKAFKGLEADVVILYDVSAFGRLFSLRDLYVAATRPKHRLFICAAPGEARATLEAACAAAGRS